MIEPTQKIWHNGKFINWEAARVHVMTHAPHYGTSVFEGIRCYSTPSGGAIFRPKEHIRRFFDSAKIYRMDEIGFDQKNKVINILKSNKFYINKALKDYAKNDRCIISTKL